MIPMLYDCFKRWSEKGSVYIISDPHFEDEDCKYMDPCWPSPQEYVDKLNKKLTKNDTLVCLGDCGDVKWFNKLKAGYKVLIKGNHDDSGNAFYQKIRAVFTHEEVTPELLQDYRKKGYYNLKYYEQYQHRSPFHFYYVYGDKGEFNEVYSGPLIIAPKIILSHEPIFGLEQYMVNIHGHEHNYIYHEKHINLAANVYHFDLFNLGKEIKKGLVSKTDDIHRVTIDLATDKKEGKNE